MDLEIIRDPGKLHEFLPEWRSFTGRLQPATPFQSPAWLLTWWSHFGSGELHVMLFREAAEVIGVLPAFVHEWNGNRQMTLVGTGLSDYLDPLFDPSHTPAIVDQLTEHLQQCSEWDVCDWQDLSADTPLGRLGQLSEDTPCSQVVLLSDFDLYLAERPKDLQRNIARYRRKAEAAGSFTFNVTAEAEPQLIQALIDLHGARWRKSGEEGMIEANHAAAFLPDVCQALAEVQSLLIFTLRFQGHVAAIIVAFQDGKAIYGYLTGYDPEHEYYSFGRELLAQALKYAHEHGYRSWNFLRGTEPYKLLWGAEPIPKFRLRFTRLQL